MVSVNLSREKIIGLSGMVGSAFIGGAVMPVLIREGGQIFHPFLFNWLRALSGLIFILPLFLTQPNWRSITKMNLLPVIIILGCGLGANITFFSFGVQHTTLVASQLMYVLVPVVVSVLAYFFIGEKFTRSKLYGMTLALIGILILIFSSQSDQERLSLGTFEGNMLIFMGMVGYSAYIAFSKKYVSKLSPVSLVTITNAALLLFLLPTAAWSLKHATFQNFFSAEASLLIIGIGISSISMIGLVQLSLKYISATTSSFSTLIGPQFAVLTGIILYQEKLSAMLLLSLLLTSVGVMMSASGERKNWREKLRSFPQILKSR